MNEQDARAIQSIRQFITEAASGDVRYGADSEVISEAQELLLDVERLQRRLEGSDWRPRPMPPTTGSPNEAVVRHISDPPDPVRMEVKENAKGEPQVSVRITGTHAAQVCEDALSLYWSTKDRLVVKAKQDTEEA